jgi:hypothetical protein
LLTTGNGAAESFQDDKLPSSSTKVPSFIPVAVELFKRATDMRIFESPSLCKDDFPSRKRRDSQTNVTVTNSSEVIGMGRA